MLEEGAQHGFGRGRQLNFTKRIFHESDPAVPGLLIHREGCMTHAKAGVATLFDVAWRASKAEDEEVTKPFFGALQVVRRIHRPKDAVAGDLPVECGHQATETVLADFFKNVIFRELIWHPSIVANHG